MAVALPNDGNAASSPPDQSAKKAQGSAVEREKAASAGAADMEQSAQRERFIPITRFALIDRLTNPDAWPPGEARHVRRFFRYLDYWRQQQYNAKLLSLEQNYEPFSPDSDLLITRSYTDDERSRLKRRVVDEIEYFLTQANYTRVDPSRVEIILTRDSYYGLDLQVDLQAFEELLIYYRGASARKDRRRTWRKFMLKQEFDVPIYRRLFVLFKLKTEAQRIEEVMRQRDISQSQATRLVRGWRRMLPAEVSDRYIYMKLFKNIPRTDLEMIFPNTRVNFRLMDKLKLGITGGAGFGVGAFGAAGKIALAATNPIAAAGAIVGLAGICFRQAMNFINQRQRYMIIMAQNLYFHAMADNRGVGIKLADRAAEEDVKEEMLLYAVLAKEQVNARDLKAVDEAIEKYLLDTFGVTVDFDLDDALGRLKAEGLVTEDRDGNLSALPPAEAARHIDRKWDVFLDDLPDLGAGEGTEAVDSSGIAA